MAAASNQISDTNAAFLQPFFARLQLSIGLQIIFQCNWCQIVIVQNMFNVLCTSNYCKMKQML